jgi:branched-chain amino acid aminotransferase
MTLQKQQFEIFNGNFIPAGSPLFNSANRAFRYGDGLFETIKVLNKKPLFLDFHLSRLNSGLQYLNMVPFEGLDIQFLQNIIDVLLVKNEIADARCRLVFYRKEGGLYNPLDNNIDWHLSISAISNQINFQSNSQLHVGLYRDDYKTRGLLSQYKTLNCLLYVQAAIEAQKLQLNDMLLLNDAGNIIEATSSNLFIVKNDEIITPPLSDGCVAGVTRAYLLSANNDLKIRQSSISEKALKDADEVFITNVINGAQPVRQFEDVIFKQYNIANKVNQLLSLYGENCNG